MLLVFALCSSQVIIVLHLIPTSIYITKNTVHGERMQEVMQAVYSQWHSMLQGNMHFDTNTYTHVNTRRTEIAQCRVMIDTPCRDGSS